MNPDSKRMGPGPILYATTLISFAVIQMIIQDFLPGLLPVPASLPIRLLWIYLTSGIFLVAGIGILLKIKLQMASVLAGTLFFIFFLFLHLPLLFSNINDAGEWSATFENLILASGAILLASYITESDFPNRGKIIKGLSRIAWYAFGISWLVFGIIHIKNNDFIQTLIPAWMPGNAFLSYLVITAYLLTAFSFLTRLLVPLASCLLGTMFLLWVLLLHGPRSFTKLTVAAEWTSLFVALAISGIAFSIFKQSIKSNANDAIHIH